VIDTLVRNGVDVRLPYDARFGGVCNTATAVYGEMLLQICRDYASLPDPRSLPVSAIVFFYDGLRPELRHATRPARKARK